MKKIIRLTESDLMRLVKRVIKEQEGVSGKHSTFLNLVTKLKPYGFIEDKRMEQMLGKGFLILSKGDDTNGIQIMFNVNNVTWSWSVVQNGVAKVNKERKIEGDYSIIDKIEGIIMNDIKPYISMKVKPTLNEQNNTENIPQLKVGLSVVVINQERRTGYMPANDPREVITYDGTVCKIGRLITLKNSKNECLEVLNDPKEFYKAGNNTLGIVHLSLDKRQINKCEEWSCK
jgi:hypothetical protein